MQLLDWEGLQEFWNKVKALVQPYVKDASLDGNTLTFTKGTGETKSFTIEGGSASNTPSYSEGLTYQLTTDKTGYAVTNIGTCTDTDIIIPPIYNGLPVKEIFGWSNTTTIISVTLPNSIISMGNYVFKGCSNLIKIIIPDSVTTIGQDIFNECPNVTVYCEAKSKPEGWHSRWDMSARHVVWNAFDFIGVHEHIENDLSEYVTEAELEEKGYLTETELGEKGYATESYVDEKLSNIPSGGSPMTSITYAELRALRDAGNLIPGMFYRITDYECTTSQEGTRATNHRFYIIVQALSHDTLSETAKADLGTDGTDDYFVDEGANVSAWEIKYCLDNDTTRFAWADEENGKGVIYYMKDEHGNECPYDFKNIQFKRMVSLENGYPTLDEENGEETWVYTFCGNSYHIDNDEWSELKDGSLENPYGHESDENTSTFHHNVMGEYRLLYDDENEDYTKCGKQYLNNNVFFGYWEEIGSTSPDDCPYYYGYCCFGNTLATNCYNNTFGYNCNHNTLGYNCYLNTFNDYCINNTLGDYGYCNMFGHSCSQNTLGYNCFFNTLDDGISGNYFAMQCCNTQISGSNNFYACAISNKTLTHNDSFVSQI